MDLLEYPACKLYDKGKFRLPNKVRKQLEQNRVRQLVIIPSDNNKLKMIPASKWDRMKAHEKKKVNSIIPVRPQAIVSTFLELNPELLDFIGETEYLHFETRDNYFLIWNDADYKEENEILKKQIHNMYHGVNM